MADIAIRLDEFNRMDLAIENDDVATDAGLETAVFLSLFTDLRRPELGVCVEPCDGRGWWGDAFQEPEGDAYGSLLWTLARVTTRNLETTAPQFARDGLEWMREDSVAASVEATAALGPAPGTLCLNVQIDRPVGEQLNVRFAPLWESLAV